MSFPSIVLNFGVGNIPIRYIYNIYIFKYVKYNVHRCSVYFLILPMIHILYMSLGEVFTNRKFNLIDISYLLNYIFIFMSINIVYKYPEEFIRFMYIFTVINISWAFIQNIMLIIGVNDIDILMLFSNIKSNSYSIPPSPYIGQYGFYRYSGFFHESAPFVIYLLFSHFLFTYVSYRKNLKNIIFIAILLSGAKIGVLYIVLNILIVFLSFFRIKLSYVIVSTLSIVFVSIPFLNEYLLINVNGTGYGTLYLRFSSVFSSFNEFTNSFETILFGLGFLPSSATMGANRGLDFFSVYIVSNGIIGTIILIFPYVFMIIKANKYLTLKEENVMVSSLFLSLLTSGSLLIIQYTYFILMLIVTIKIKIKIKGKGKEKNDIYHNSYFWKNRRNKEIFKLNK